MNIAPVRIQLSRAAGFNLQAYSLALNGLRGVKVDRSTRYGNPYRLGKLIDMKQARRWGWNISPSGQQQLCFSSAEAEQRFRYAVIWDEAIHDFLREQLGGRNLACWCHEDEHCHTDSLLFVANSKPDDIHAIHRAIDGRLLAESRR